MNQSKLEMAFDIIMLFLAILLAPISYVLKKILILVNYPVHKLKPKMRKSFYNYACALHHEVCKRSEKHTTQEEENQLRNIRKDIDLLKAFIEYPRLSFEDFVFIYLRCERIRKQIAGISPNN